MSPKKQYLIGVDLGTSSTKAALYSTDGRLVAEKAAPVPIHNPKPAVVEQDCEDFYQTAAATVRYCVEASGIDPKQVAAIACDSQMAGVGAIDENFNAITHFDSWLDMRCQPYIEHIDKNFGDRVTELTGCPPTCDHAPKIMWWREEHPEAYARTAKYVMPSTYVAGRMGKLTAVDAFIDYTFLHFSGLSDAQAGTWSSELCTNLGVDQEKLPKIVDPWHIVGEVSDEAAADFGLAAGTPIAAGCGDTAAGALGAGIVRPNMVFDVAGTASVFAASTNQFVADTHNRALLTMRSVIPNLWNPLAYIGGGGQALRWYRDNFYNHSRGTTLELEEDLYPEVIALARRAPAGCDGLFFSPHIGGRICPSTPEMRGAWIGFSWSHSQAHFARAILESIAYEYAYYLSILRNALPNLALFEARVIGGGARSTDWNQMKADILEVPYRRLQRSEFGTWGSAMLAGKAVGVFDDLAEVATQFADPSAKVLMPRSERSEIYRPTVKKYIALQSILAETFVHTLNAAN